MYSTIRVYIFIIIKLSENIYKKNKVLDVNKVHYPNREFNKLCRLNQIDSIFQHLSAKKKVTMSYFFKSQSIFFNGHLNYS